MREREEREERGCRSPPSERHDRSEDAEGRYDPEVEPRQAPEDERHPREVIDVLVVRKLVAVPEEDELLKEERRRRPRVPEQELAAAPVPEARHLARPQRPPLLALRDAHAVGVLPGLAEHREDSRRPVRVPVVADEEVDASL
jgi:hypothetical protein